MVVMPASQRQVGYGQASRNLGTKRQTWTQRQSEDFAMGTSDHPQTQLFNMTGMGHFEQAVDVFDDETALILQSYPKTTQNLNESQRFMRTLDSGLSLTHRNNLHTGYEDK